MLSLKPPVDQKMEDRQKGLLDDPLTLFALMASVPVAIGSLRFPWPGMTPSTWRALKAGAQSMADRLVMLKGPDPYLHRALRGPLWHGSNNLGALIKEGFQLPTQLGIGPAVGEPSGISTSLSPWIAKEFGDPVVRIIPRIGVGNRVLRLYNPDEVRTYRSALAAALQDIYGLSRLRDKMKYFESVHGKLPLTKGEFSGTPIEQFRLWLDPRRVKIADALRDQLLDRRFAAVLYYPGRFSEAEVRFLDPKFLTPVETRSSKELKLIPRDIGIFQGVPFGEYIPPFPSSLTVPEIVWQAGLQAAGLLV